MDSSTKLAGYLQSAAKGKVDDLPTGIVKGLRILLAAKPKLLREIADADPGNVDEAMLGVATIALRMRSDNAKRVDVDYDEAGDVRVTLAAVPAKTSWEADEVDAVTERAYVPDVVETRDPTAVEAAE